MQTDLCFAIVMLDKVMLRRPQSQNRARCFSNDLFRRRSEERARQMERGYSLLIVGGRIIKRGQDEEIYYNHTAVTSKDKEVSVKFSMPRKDMGELLSKAAAK